MSAAVSPADTVRPHLGLALSGGGFRAAFFHIGVLARMAELGLLRQVRVISTVSGGSIVGALYYLHVRALLQAVPDAKVTDDHYLRLVEHLERTFLAAVETNIRGRTFVDLRNNFRMARRDYSRSDRLGELYDETFYRPAWNKPLFGEPPDRPRETMIELRELLVTPAGHTGPFNPTENNLGRNAPVPILVLNATSLNTGHNWRFEVVGMGEPDRHEDAVREVDRNKRLRWTRYERMPESQASFELGAAVAASACVPSLFQPLPVTRLFREPDGTDITVELVDGGVHDNQGIASLLEYDCRPIVISDASGYLPDDDDPVTRIPGVAGRSIGIYGDRVREEQLIQARLEEARRPLALMHLRKGIPGVALAPIGPDGEPIEPPRREPPDDFRGEMFGVAASVQNLLSRVRTDLDSFSEIEAYTLELDGYGMAKPNLLDEPAIVALTHEGGDRAWRFLTVATAAEQGTHALYLRHLTKAKSRFFKAAALSLTGKIEGLIMALLALGLVGGLLLIDRVRAWFAADFPVWATLAVVGVALLVLALYMLPRLAQPMRGISEFLFTQAFPALLAIPFWISSLATLLLSKAFLAAGRVQRVLG